MRSYLTVLLCVLVLLAVGAAAQPKVVNSFPTGGFGSVFPGGLGYDTVADHLYVADETNNRVYQITRTGTAVSTINTATLGLINPIGAGVDAKGRLLYLADEKTGGGEKIWALDIKNNFAVVTMAVVTTLGSTDISGLDYDPIANYVVAGNDGPAMVVQYDLNFNVVSSLKLPAAVTDGDGLGINTFNGVYLVGDDTNKLLYEIAPDGYVLNSYKTTTFGVNDPEGVCMDPQNGNYFISTTVNPDTVYELAGGLTLGPALTADKIVVPASQSVTVKLRLDPTPWPFGGIALISPVVFLLTFQAVAADGTVTFGPFLNPGLGGVSVTLLGAGVNGPSFQQSNSLTITFN